jgi:pyrroline-5-carboxylate reductase
VADKSISRSQIVLDQWRKFCKKILVGPEQKLTVDIALSLSLHRSHKTKDSMKENIGFIGAGRMATALASGFVQAGQIAPQQIYAADPSKLATAHFQQAIGGCQIVSDNAALIQKTQIVILAIKPQIFPQLHTQLHGKFAKDQLVISIAAGISLNSLAAGLHTNCLIRVMPNTPCLVSKGACGYAAAEGVSVEQKQQLQRLLSTVGLAFEVTENLLNVVTALSGSGPAYVFEIIESLSDGAVRMGLPRALATQLAAQTLYGAAAMVMETGEHPAALKDQVSSPGGTTIAGLYELEKGALRATLMAAVQAATERAIELGKSG